MPSTDRTPAQAERLGALWRSQGDVFLEEHAQELQGDINRLRDLYLAGAEPAERPRARPRVPTLRPSPAKVVDLRRSGVESMDCRTHGDAAAVALCHRCGSAFCAHCILRSEVTRDQPLCTECALNVSGVHHKRAQPHVVAGRPGRSAR